MKFTTGHRYLLIDTKQNGRVKDYLIQDIDNKDNTGEWCTTDEVKSYLGSLSKEEKKYALNFTAQEYPLGSGKLIIRLNYEKATKILPVLKTLMTSENFETLIKNIEDSSKSKIDRSLISDVNTVNKVSKESVTPEKEINKEIKVENNRIKSEEFKEDLRNKARYIKELLDLATYFKFGVGQIGVKTTPYGEIAMLLNQQAYANKGFKGNSTRLIITKDKIEYNSGGGYEWKVFTNAEDFYKELINLATTFGTVEYSTSTADEHNDNEFKELENKLNKKEKELADTVSELEEYMNKATETNTLISSLNTEITKLKEKINSLEDIKDEQDKLLSRAYTERDEALKELEKLKVKSLNNIEDTKIDFGSDETYNDNTNNTSSLDSILNSIDSETDEISVNTEADEEEPNLDWLNGEDIDTNEFGGTSNLKESSYEFQWSPDSGIELDKGEVIVEINSDDNNYFLDISGIMTFSTKYEKTNENEKMIDDLVDVFNKLNSNEHKVIIRDNTGEGFGLCKSLISLALNRVSNTINVIFE